VELSGGLGWGHDCLAGELRVDLDLCKCGSRTSTLRALAGFEPCSSDAGEGDPGAQGAVRAIGLVFEPGGALDGPPSGRS
jgi:hypothetical protein